MSKDTNDALKVIELAIEREQKGNSFYSKAASTTKAVDGSRMFTWLAKEELGHLKHLEEIRQSLIKTGSFPRVNDKAAGISDPLDKTGFPWASDAVGEVKADTKELEALRIGINAEKEDIAFYSKAAKEASDPDVKEMFNKLVAVEKGHQELLEEEYEWLSKSKTYFTIHRFNLPK